MQSHEAQWGTPTGQDQHASTPHPRTPQKLPTTVAAALLLLSSAVPLHAWASQQVSPAPAIAPSPAAPPATTAPQGVPNSSAAAPSSTPPSVASPVPNPVPGVDANHYIIGPEDSLQITVWKEPTLTGVVPVRPDGMISMALLNDVPAAGLTPMQLSTDISTKLKKYIQDPIVSVLVSGVNSRKIYFVGEINRVGPLSLASEMTVLQAISAAGGVTTFAHSKRIYILRGAKGHEQKIFFNYKQALKGDSRQDIALQPGDTIVVP